MHIHKVTHQHIASKTGNKKWKSKREQSESNQLCMIYYVCYPNRQLFLSVMSACKKILWESGRDILLNTFTQLIIRENNLFCYLDIKLFA